MEVSMLKIWGRTDSSNVQKVLWCCGELGLDFDRVDLGGKFGGNKEKAYLDKNPNGLVPTLEDGDFILWKSNSIMRYLVDKYGRGRLLPSTPEGRADANRWFTLPVERPKLANVDAWYQRLCEQPPYQKHIMIPLT